VPEMNSGSQNTKTTFWKYPENGILVKQVFKVLREVFGLLGFTPIISRVAMRSDQCKARQSPPEKNTEGKIPVHYHTWQACSNSTLNTDCISS